MTSTNTADETYATISYWDAKNAEHSAKSIAETNRKWTRDNSKTCAHCKNQGHIIENCYKLDCETQNAQQILNDTQCEQCKEYGHIKTTCPRTPDSPRTKDIKYNLYIDGGYYQGVRYYEGDFQGGAEYLQDEINKKYALMTQEEYEEHLDEFDRW
jgi:hypothetical protein